MKEKCKLKLGQKGCSIYYSDKEKIKMIEDYLTSGLTKREIWEKHTGKVEEHGTLLKWMRGYGIKDKIEKKIKFAVKPKSKQMKFQEDKFEILQLRKRVEDLEKQLSLTELKATAFSTMIDIAEDEFKIPIRKKLNTKPSKK